MGYFNARAEAGPLVYFLSDWQCNSHIPNPESSLHRTRIRVTESGPEMRERESGIQDSDPSH